MKTKEDQLHKTLMQWIDEMEFEWGDSEGAYDIDGAADGIIESLKPYFPDRNKTEWRKEIEDDLRESIKRDESLRFAKKAMVLGESRSNKQKETRSKRHTWKGQTCEQLSERNQEIIEHFKKTRFTPSNFANIHAAKYGIKPRTVRLILSKAVGS